MLRNYEFTMIVRPDLSEEDLASVFNGYENKITEEEGSILKKDVWGTKRFSYPIKKYFRGYYVVYEISALPKIIKDIDHQIRFDDKVLRHIVIGVPKGSGTVSGSDKYEPPASAPDQSGKQGDENERGASDSGGAEEKHAETDTVSAPMASEQQTASAPDNVQSSET